MTTKLTVSQLKKMCKKKGIKGYSKMKKAELMKICLVDNKQETKPKKVIKKVVKKVSPKKEAPTQVKSNSNLLSRVEEMVKDVNKSNSVLVKKTTLKNYDDMKKVLRYTYDENKVFSITSKNYLKFEKNDKKDKTKTVTVHIDLFTLLDDLVNRKITGDTALLHLFHFVNNNSQYKQYILNIIDKSLKLRLNTSVINKVFPGLIPVFQPVLANKFDPKRLEKSKEDWFISRKLDGVRCLGVVNPQNKTVKFLSRKGKEFGTLDVLRQEILKNISVFKEPFVLDGEVVSMEDGVEDFTGIMKQIKKKNYTMPNPKYFAFDMIKLDDFYQLSSTEKYSVRLNRLNETLKNRFPSFEILEQVKYTEEDFARLIKEAEEKNYEGLMIREDVAYEGKRTNSLLKYKKMMDDEFKVLDVITGPWRHISKETGLEETIQTVVAVRIDYKEGVKVGSGFSLDERNHFYKHPEDIVGKVITVQFFEKTPDSLRFPVFKYLHGLKRDT